MKKVPGGHLGRFEDAMAAKSKKEPETRNQSRAGEGETTRLRNRFRCQLNQKAGQVFFSYRHVSLLLSMLRF